MYYREHGVPHFHATYASETVVIAIQTGDVIAGNVPARALRLVKEWSALHRDELRLNWARAREHAPLASAWDWRGVFEPLSDPVFFARVELDRELGTINWPNGADVAPETLHFWVAQGRDNVSA